MKLPFFSFFLSFFHFFDLIEFDIFTFSLRTELSAKHAKHIADLKLYYEYEINELKSQLNRIRMGFLTHTHKTKCFILS